MEINIEISSVLSNNKRILKISNFELLFLKRNEQKNTSTPEMKCHIKYIVLKDRNNTKITLERKDINEKYSIKTNSTQDMDNLISTLNLEQEKYKSFIKEYYGDNNSYNLIEGDSFMEYFADIKNFLESFSQSLEKIFMNVELQKLLDLISTLIEKCDYYLEVINQNENKIKELGEDIYLESKEIKELLSNLKQAVNNCSFGLNKNEIKEYVVNFKNIVKEKVQEIHVLIDEIKYNLGNYLALKIEDDMIDDKNKIFESKEEELTKVLLENESLKIQNENLVNENLIISQFLNDNKNKKY